MHVIKDMLTRTEAIRPKNQIWMLYMLECPLHTGKEHTFSKNKTERSTDAVSLCPGAFSIFRM